VNEAIKHTPTLIECKSIILFKNNFKGYLLKGKILKHQEKFEEAFEEINFARDLDLADRYLNNKGKRIRKAIKYTLYCNNTRNAEKLIKIFMKHEVDMNIYELQTTWYEREVAYAHLRLKNYGPCLRHFKFLLKQYEDIQNDAFDFHMYCFRKYTLREYLELLDFCQNLAGGQKESSVAQTRTKGFQLPFI